MRPIRKEVFIVLNTHGIRVEGPIFGTTPYELKLNWAMLNLYSVVYDLNYYYGKKDK